MRPTCGGCEKLIFSAIKRNLADALAADPTAGGFFAAVNKFFAAAEKFFHAAEKFFHAAPEGDYFARAWRLRWEKLMPAYLAWQRERENLGWRWQASEVSREQALELASGRMITLRGRFDRIDTCRDEANQEVTAVLDYKTGSNKQLKDRAANPGEDGQLPFYGMIAANLPDELAYIALDNDPVAAYAVPGDIAAIVTDQRDRLRQTLDAIEAGKGLPAHGVDSVCDYCEVGGICRKRYWDNGDGN